MPLATQPRSIDNDDDVLRAVASCANEAIDATALPEPRRLQAMRRVGQRYARALHISFNDLQDALSAASGGARQASGPKTSEAPAFDSEPQHTLT
jgi:non-specific serine/threonine protein kinase